MLSRVVDLSASGLLGLGPWRSSVLGTNRQAAISTSLAPKIHYLTATID